MVDKGSARSIVVERLPNGGFFARDTSGGSQSYWNLIFACSSIEELVKFVEHAIVPPGPEPAKDESDGRV